MAASYTYTCYLIDCSPSMGRPLDAEAGHARTRLDYALDFVRVKLAQRLINPKKTDQIAIVLFGGKTDNALDNSNMDGYDHIEELIPMKQPSYEDLRLLDHIKIGDTDTDLVSAIYVAGNVVRNCKAMRKDCKKQVVLLTDAEEPTVKGEDGEVQVITTWNDEDWLRPLYEAVVPGLNGQQVNWKALFSLGVIGMDFGEPDVDERFEKTWSEAQKINIDGLRGLVNKLNDLSASTGQARAILGSVLSATAGASAPSIAPIKTVTKHTKLIIGDEDEYPRETLSFNVLVQKATQKAAAKSMQKMRRGTWKKSLLDDPVASANGHGKKRRRRAGSDEEDEEAEEDNEDRSTLHDPGALVPEKQWYYVPDYTKDKKPRLNDQGELENGNEDGNESEEDEVEKAKRSEESRRLATDENLSRAYKYGSDLIPISKDEEQDFYTFPAGEPGLMVRGFIKTSQFHPEWALGDPFWVFGGDDSTSQVAFSALLWAMQETKTIAVVRMLLPKLTQPRVALLIPKVGEDAVDERMEMGLLVPMPFKEEIANWSFPSLDRIHTVTGKPVTEHRLLPKPDLLHSMDDFVDSMMLPVYTNEEEPKAEGEDEDMKGESSATTPWFDPVESYNPSIHNMRNCVIQKLLNPSHVVTDDLEVHPALTRFLFPPDETMDASAVPAMSLSKAAGLTLIPPKPKMARGRGRKKQAQKPSKTALEELLGEEANGEEDEEATQATQQPWLAQSQKLYRHHATFSESQAASQSQSQNQGRGVASPAGKTQKKTPEKKATKQDKKGDDSSATEASDEETDNDSKPGQTDGVDGTGTGHAKPSLLSYDDPIPDFEKLIKQGGMMTSTSMRQMCEMIPVFIKDAKTEAELKKSRDCLVHARRAAIEEDESVLYNGLLHTIKEIVSKPPHKHTHFFQSLKKENLGLVTKAESESHHGDPEALDGAVSEEEANEFWK